MSELFRGERFEVGEDEQRRLASAQTVTSTTTATGGHGYGRLGAAFIDVTAGARSVDSQHRLFSQPAARKGHRAGGLAIGARASWRGLGDRHGTGPKVGVGVRVGGIAG